MEELALYHAEQLGMLKCLKKKKKKKKKKKNNNNNNNNNIEMFVSLSIKCSVFTHQRMMDELAHYHTELIGML